MREDPGSRASTRGKEERHRPPPVHSRRSGESVAGGAGAPSRHPFMRPFLLTRKPAPPPPKTRQREVVSAGLLPAESRQRNCFLLSQPFTLRQPVVHAEPCEDIGRGWRRHGGVSCRWFRLVAGRQFKTIGVAEGGVNQRLGYAACESIPPKSTEFRFFSSPNSNGISPVNWLSERSGLVSSERSPSSAGISPVNWLPERSRLVRSERSPSSAGISPVNWLLERSS